MDTFVDFDEDATKFTKNVHGEHRSTAWHTQRLVYVNDNGNSDLQLMQSFFSFFCEFANLKT